MENYLEYIDDYFGGMLNPEESKEFQRRLENDKMFADEVAFYLAAKQASKEEVIKDKKEWFREIAGQNPSFAEVRSPARIKRMWTYRLAAAASVVGILLLSWYFFLQKPASPDRLADRYIKS